jgi:hypothetical protein
MARKMMKKPSGKHEGGTGIMPKQFSGKKPMVKGGDGKKARDKRLEGKAL